LRIKKKIVKICYIDWFLPLNFSQLQKLKNKKGKYCSHLLYTIDKKWHMIHWLQISLLLEPLLFDNTFKKEE